VFWNVSSIFSNCSKKVSAKRVFLITCNDDPNAGDAGKQRSSLTRANDLRDMDIAIELFAWEGSENPFRFDVFYKSILQDEDSQDYVFSAVSKLEEFQTNLRRKEVKRVWDALV
jgi:hypothetical protein